jgi:hypothetical protein
MGILDQAVITVPKEKKMKQIIKKMLGIDKIEDRADRMEKAAREMASHVDEANKKVAEAELKLAEKVKTPKEIATENKEPWVCVIETHVGKENVRNGFFELDWNEFFVLQLRDAGYSGGDDEEVVDRWFTELCRNVGGEEGVDMAKRSTGYVQRALRDDGMTEIG